jgi:hemerythrin-like domain-containing protein
VRLTDLLPKGLLKDGQDAISLLEADHDKVLALFEHFEDIKDSRAEKEKQTIVADACRELTIHTKLEEEVFYPAVRGALDDEDLMNEALVEHDGAKSLIQDLEGMDAGDEMFNAKFIVLSEYIKHHVKEERQEMFPKVRATDVDLKALGAKMLERKAQLMKGNGSGAGRPRPPARRKSRAASSKRASAP